MQRARKRRFAFVVVFVAPAAAVLAWLTLGTPGGGVVVRTRTTHDTHVFWRQAQVEMTLSSVENPQLPADRLRAALTLATQTWDSATGGCHAPRLTVAAATTPTTTVGTDSTNLVVWRLRGFCDGADNAKDDLCLAPDAVASTTVFYVDKPGDPDDGMLFEADMEINAASFAFADDGSADKIDILGTMVHESGHVLGLDHTCATNATTNTDTRGAPVPNCYGAAMTDAERNAVMYPFEKPGDVSRRQPLSEESQGLCAIYEAMPAASAAPAGGSGPNRGAPAGGCSISL